MWVHPRKLSPLLVPQESSADGHYLLLLLPVRSTANDECKFAFVFFLPYTF
jgi:hypothetical protein